MEEQTLKGAPNVCHIFTVNGNEYDKLVLHSHTRFGHPFYTWGTGILIQ
jgi:hypothetical protein